MNRFYSMLFSTCFLCFWSHWNVTLSIHWECSLTHEQGSNKEKFAGLNLTSLSHMFENRQLKTKIHLPKFIQFRGNFTFFIHFNFMFSIFLPFELNTDFQKNISFKRTIDHFSYFLSFKNHTLKICKKFSFYHFIYKKRFFIPMKVNHIVPCKHQHKNTNPNVHFKLFKLRENVLFAILKNKKLYKICLTLFCFVQIYKERKCDEQWILQKVRIRR